MSKQAKKYNVSKSHLKQRCYPRSWPDEGDLG